MRINLELIPGRHIILEGSGAVAEIAIREMEVGAIGCTRSDPLFRFCITDRPPPPHDGPSFGNARAIPDGVAWRLERMDYDLVMRACAPLDVTMHIGSRGPPFHIPRFLFSTVERTAMSWVEIQAYHAALLVEFLALVSGQAGLLHASAVERDGRALVLTSAGGVGKTTSACRLVSTAGFRHLADDMLLVDTNGRCRSSARKLMVYPYNARDIPGLEASVRKESGRARLLWDLDRLFRIGRRRRRIAAHDLFGTKVASEGKFDAVVLLRKARASGLQFHDVTAQSLAVRATEIVVSEFGPFMDLLRLSTALVGDGFFWSPARVVARNVDTLTSAFEGARRLCVGDLGPNFDPTESLSAFMAQ